MNRFVSMTGSLFRGKLFFIFPEIFKGQTDCVCEDLKWHTGSELALHYLGLGSLSAVKQPALPVRPQHQSRGTAVRGRVRRARPEESQIHGHPPGVTENCFLLSATQ